MIYSRSPAIVRQPTRIDRALCPGLGLRGCARLRQGYDLALMCADIGVAAPDLGWPAPTCCPIHAYRLTLQMLRLLHVVNLGARAGLGQIAAMVSAAWAFANVRIGTDRAQARQGTYEREEPKLARGPHRCAAELPGGRRSPVIVLVTGIDGAGKGEVIHRLNEWLDPRHLQTRPTTSRRRGSGCGRGCGATGATCRPRARSAIVFGSWYNEPCSTAARGEIGDAAGSSASSPRSSASSAMLADEGALILKFRLVLSRQGAEAAAQGARQADAGREPRAGGMERLKQRRQALAAGRGALSGGPARAMRPGS